MRKTIFYSDWNGKTYHRFSRKIEIRGSLIRYFTEGILVEYKGNPFELTPLKHYKVDEVL